MISSMKMLNMPAILLINLEEEVTGKEMIIRKEKKKKTEIKNIRKKTKSITKEMSIIKTEIIIERIIDLFQKFVILLRFWRGAC